MVDVRLLHHGQKLARIRGEGLHVAPLALGVDGVEGQGGLAGARQPRDHDEPVPGQVQVDVLQVMGARAPNADGIHGISRWRSNLLIYAAFPA